MYIPQDVLIDVCTELSMHHEWNGLTRNENEYIICNGFDKFGEFGKYPDTEKTEAQLYDEMFGQGSWRKDATAYNQSLEMYSRTTERLMSVEALSTQLN